MDTKQIANAIRSLDKTGRQELARQIRVDASVWNGINGLGDIQKNLPNGKFNGIIKENATLLDKVKIVAKNADITKEAISNLDGTYSIELPVGTYDIVFIREGYYDNVEKQKYIVCETAITLNSEMTKL